MKPQEPTVRISRATHRTLKQLARQKRQTMSDVLDAAIEAEKRRRFFSEVKEGYARLRADPKAWAEYQTELKLWDVTLMDGLDPNERWEETADGLARPVQTRLPRRQASRRKRS